MRTAFTTIPSALALDLAIRAASTVMKGKHTSTHDTLKKTPQEKYGNGSSDSIQDDTAMTDHSTDVSPLGSPTSVSDVTMMAAATTRPTQRRKRKRMSPDERKVRHREIQRQFMKRKRARIVELRKVQNGVEKQLRLVRVLVEIEQLRTENDRLEAQYKTCEDAEPPTNVAVRMSFGDLVFSVPTEIIDESHGDFHMTKSEWDELFDVLSDDADLGSADDSDAGSLC